MRLPGATLRSPSQRLPSHLTRRQGLTLTTAEATETVVCPCPAPVSPLSLAEPLHGPEPGPKVLLGLEAVIIAGRLEQLDLGDHFEFLGPEGRAG